MDKSHNPEFTSLEFYWAFVDYEELMVFVEKMLESIVVNIFGAPKLLIKERKLILLRP